jgi:hypothetical protein
MNSQRTFRTILVALTFALPSVPALADDAKVYAPEFCRATSGTITYTAEGIFNASMTTPLMVQCPIVRDETANTVEYVDVLVRDRNAAASNDVACYMQERTINGDVTGSSWIYTPGGGAHAAGGQGMLTLFSNSSNQPRYNAAPRSSLMLICWIPLATSSNTSDRSGLLLYEVQEDN